ncbi:MAG: hypothetical protein IPM66_15665 [Acidobacteriota bacterium]|nr:MAG: hypothetical protein IPM66_15665 [Acidobacteriota bacterium]
MFIISGKEATTDYGADAVAASKMLKGKSGLVTTPNVDYSPDKSAFAAAEWFRENLGLK